MDYQTMEAVVIILCLIVAFLWYHVRDLRNDVNELQEQAQGLRSDLDELQEQVEELRDMLIPDAGADF